MSSINIVACCFFGPSSSRWGVDVHPDGNVSSARLEQKKETSFHSLPEELFDGLTCDRTSIQGQSCSLNHWQFRDNITPYVMKGNDTFRSKTKVLQA